MGWLLLLLVVIALLLLARTGKKRRTGDAAATIRSRFAPLARMRLVAACPGLDDVLDEASLRMLFDWIVTRLHRHAGTSDLDGLMRWSISAGETEARRLTAEVARDAVDRLPRPALDVIDQCGGRTFAAVIIDEALGEAGHQAATSASR